MNYIRHIENVHDRFFEDDRLSPWHISLYYALFHLWNSASFPESISISRSEMMKASKIGSVNTYLKCLKELESFGYLKYTPSRNPQKGSSVYLFIFDTTNELQVNQKDTGSDTTDELRVRPYINNININKPIKHFSEEGKDDLEVVPSKKSKTERFSPPSIDEIILFFRENKKSDLEAEKFFNHFESNGWLVGGKSKMKNWQAAARNWILNSQKWNPPEKHPAGNLHVNQEKDYSLPL